MTDDNRVAFKAFVYYGDREREPVYLTPQEVPKFIDSLQREDAIMYELYTLAEPPKLVAWNVMAV